MLLFPGMVLHFDIARPRSIAALEQAMQAAGQPRQEKEQQA